MQTQVAVEGCCHGRLDDIYKQVASMERKGKYKVDLLLICGDFQATRNAQDLECMVVPPKHKHLNDFPKYNPFSHFESLFSSLT